MKKYIKAMYKRTHFFHCAFFSSANNYNYNRRYKY